MKRILATLALMMTIVISASAMTYSQARDEAMYLTDKMAFELRLSAEQMAAVYEINLDYMLSLDHRGDLYGIYWNRRNSDLRFVLTSYQYELYMAANYFYRPISWRSGAWHFGIYARYNNRGYYYYDRPSVYHSYRGGNSRISNYYRGRNYNQPRGSGHGVGNWHHDGPGNGYPAGRPNYNSGSYNGSSNHGTTQHNHGTTNWRQNATTNRNNGSTTQPRNNGSNRNNSGTNSRSTNGSSNRSTSGNFGGARK